MGGALPSDRLRETLFNVLAPRIAGARVLDVYAGTGALGLEALSRGADSVVFIEHDRRAQRLIDENARHCGVADRCVIIRGQASGALERLRARPDFTPFDIVLLDPPYDRPPASVLDGVDDVVAERGVVVLERARRASAPDRVGRLVKQRDLASGDSVLSWYALST
jgi:16S rRNA (guanine966-N2)-methyltransferase